MGAAFDRRAWECEAWLDDDGFVMIKVESLDPSVARPEDLFILAAKRKLQYALKTWGMHQRTAERAVNRTDFEQWDEDKDWATGHVFVRVYRTVQPVAERLARDEALA
jgi:hypothetical protein